MQQAAYLPTVFRVDICRGAATICDDCATQRFRAASCPLRAMLMPERRVAANKKLMIPCYIIRSTVVVLFDECAQLEIPSKKALHTQ
jgi:hypothetical protein